ncbi:MAG: helix-turn-helix domain-containing protein [Thermoleophilia bacterium]
MDAPGYVELAPPPGSDGAIACLWVHRAPAGADGLTRVLPDACCDLIWRTGGEAFVAGPDTGAIVALSPAGSLTVGARFAPGAGGAALGLPLDELRDRRVDLADIDPRLVPDLPVDASARQALAALSAGARRLVARRAPDAAVAEAARLLADPRRRVEELAAELGLSERQLRRRTRAAAGYGPKTLQRVLRFRRAVAAVDAAGPQADLARIALAAGYADQPHLSREFRRLSGLSPGALAIERLTG